jgi:diguanylate cyclase (GGDEF)-like protein
MSAEEPTTVLLKDSGKRRDRGEKLVPTLTILEGPDVGVLHALDAGQRAHRIGRAEDADFRIDNASVSRYHAVFVVASHEGHRAVRLQDNDSTNGVLVNGRQVKDAWLISGDKIRMGDILLRFEWMSEQEVRYHSEVSEKIRAGQRDHLTGLLSRGFLESRLDSLVAELERRGRHAAALLVDLDHFKQINDRFGHLAGDAVVQRASTAVVAGLRRSDHAVRYGGEELLVLMPDTELPVAMEVAERLRARIEALKLEDLGAGLRVTASIGVARRVLGESGPDWFARADRALYDAKGKGRNRVVLAEDPEGASLPAPPPGTGLTQPMTPWTAEEEGEDG